MKNKCLWMVALLWLMTTAAAAQNGKAWLADAKAKQAEGQMKEAVELYEKAAAAGLPEAQYRLGSVFYEGKGVDKDYTTAAMWFKRAARNRYADAEYSLALCYMHGHGVPVSYDKALMYMKASALRGNTEAQVRLSELYEKGIMVEADSAESHRWLAMSRGEKVEIAPEEERPVKVKTVEPAPTQPTVAAASVTPTETQPAETAVSVTPEQAEQPADTTLLAEATADTLALPAVPDSDAIRKQELLAKMYQPRDLIARAKASEIGGGAAAGDADGRLPMEALLPSEARRSDASAAVNRPVKSEDVFGPTGAPIIKILYPEDQSYFHTDVVKLKYQLMAQGLEPSTKITVMVDGVRQADSRAVKQANVLEVDVPNRDCTIMLFAQNENGNSVPATIRLIRENITQEDLPKLYAVAVGVGEYDDARLPSLKMTTKDAQDFANAVMSKKGHPFSDVQVKVLCDQEARRSDIFEAMEWMAQEARPNDLCMFFFAGHGYRDEKDRFYFMPYGGTTNRLYDCFSATDFKTAADEINSKFVIFADACYSAGLLEGNRSAAAQHFVEQLRRSRNGMLLYASSSGDTKSKEDPSWGNGAFTKALVEAFNGAARHDGDEGLSTRALDSYLYDAVRRTTGFKQTPVFMNPSGIEHFNIFTYAK